MPAFLNKDSQRSRPFSGVGKKQEPPKERINTHYHQKMLFKLLNADVRLVKSILLTHGFEQTESHDWNVLWTNTIGKPYLYTGLNEFQKVNHFPSSYEITRK